MASIAMEQTKSALKSLVDRGLSPKFDGSMDVIKLRAIMEMAQEQMPQEPGIKFISKEYGGIEAEICTTESAKGDYVILYIHGGGWTCGNSKTSRGYASVLAKESKHAVITITYRLAPENKYPTGLEDCISWYKGIISDYPNAAIFLLGESAGAYYSLVTALKCRDEKMRLPNGLILYSPPVELMGNLNRDFEGNKDFTIMPSTVGIMGKNYIDEINANDIYAQPYLDDFRGLPPIFISWDESESLAVDANLIVKKVKKAGGSIEVNSYSDCFHAFQTAGRGTDESYEVMKKTIAFFEKHK